MQDRLTTSFWIWGIFEMESNPCYADLLRAGRSVLARVPRATWAIPGDLTFPGTVADVRFAPGGLSTRVHAPATFTCSEYGTEQ